MSTEDFQTLKNLLNDSNDWKTGIVQDLTTLKVFGHLPTLSSLFYQSVEMNVKTVTLVFYDGYNFSS